MCGIAGLIDLKNTLSAQDLAHRAEHMAKALSHRGPDDSGVWSQPEQGIALSHRRLSIIDLSKDAAQPMLSHNNRYALVYNGEIYNFPEIKKAVQNQIRDSEKKIPKNSR